MILFGMGSFPVEVEFGDGQLFSNIDVLAIIEGMGSSLRESSAFFLCSSRGKIHSVDT